jgi:soluble lytic murein transglycosylase-like protein
MTREEMIVLAKETAARHDLPQELVCAVCEQESDWDANAIRYEPAFYDRYVYPMALKRAISETEARARAFSWGLMQTMGEVAREFGFAGKFLSELCDPGKGIEMGCKVLSHKLAVNQGNVANALLAWNGGGNPRYPEQVLARVERYKS